MRCPGPPPLLKLSLTPTRKSSAPEEQATPVTDFGAQEKRVKEQRERSGVREAWSVAKELAGGLFGDGSAERTFQRIQP